MNEIKEKFDIKDLIYEIRGQYVMLDSDLAKLYKCKNGTKTINLAVKRHINRFPERFMFQVTIDEYKNLRFQIETTNNMSRSLPYVFTEQGVAMLATILRTDVAEETSIAIMDAFVAMKKYISSNLIEQKHINNIVLEHNTTLLKHDNEIKLLQETFDKLNEKRRVNEIYFNGQIYDAYSKILDIFKTSKKELIIIDSYADKTLLDIIKNINIKVIIITTNKYLKKEIINKYNEQYNNLKVIYNNTFHDRYFILDRETLYHCGSSINRIGYKTFSINLISDKDMLNALLNKINEKII